MSKTKKRTKVNATVEEEPPRDEAEKMITQGLTLKLEAIRRKNPYFKGSRRRPEHMKLSRKERREALRFAGNFAEAIFRLAIESNRFISRDTGTRAQSDWIVEEIARAEEAE
jgi:hypothetical protein